MTMRLLAATLACAALGAADFAWIEGESPTVRPTLPEGLPEGAVKYGDAWGLSRIMSDGRLLHVNVGDGDVAKHLPDGLTFGYDLQVPGGKQEVWARIGYEWVRSPIRWRIAGGAWQDFGVDQVTRDVQQIQTWNELAWARLGEIDVPAGTVRIEVQWIRPERTEKDKVKVERILGMLDALCVAKAGTFRPSGKWKPGEDHRGEAEKAADALVFKLPEGAAGGERSAVVLDGAWQMADWEEDVAPGAEPEGRLLGVAALPDLAAQRWFALRVPGDRNAQHPERVFQHRLLARCRVDVPQGFAGRSFRLEFQRFNTIASVFVNGVACGWSKDHSTAWQVDVSKAVKPGQINEIVVAVKDRYYSLNAARDRGSKRGWLGLRNTPNGFLSDNQGVCAMHDLPVAADSTVGFAEPVTLVAAGSAYVADAFVKTSVAEKRIAVETTIANPGAARTVTVALSAVPWSKAGGEAKPAKMLKPVEVQLAAGESKTVEIAEAWGDAKLWWPDDVNLYDLVATVSEGGRPIDVSRARFGFREWSWDSHVFKLNGVKWQVYGDIDANFDPRKQAEQSRQSGQNTLRLWANGGLGGLTRQATLAYCDESGLIVRSCGTLDGQLANYGGGLVEEVEVDGKKVRRAKASLVENWKSQLAAWVKAERNHPSILIWSVENEVTYINAANLGMSDQFEPAVSDAIRNVVMKVDPTRPAMVDGGNALKDESLPVNGGHYTEMYNLHWRDLPDASYGRDHWYTPESKSRGIWRYVPDRPIFKGEVFFASGYSTDQFATIGGERCFIGIGEVGDGMRRLGMIFNEGWRWSEVAAWQHWLGGGFGRYWNGWQPVAVLCRQWNTVFGAGQQVERTLKVFNNTSKSSPITAAWEVTVDGKRIAGEQREFALAPGSEQEWKISFTLPKAAKAVGGSMVLSATRAGAQIYRDERGIRVLVPALVAKPKLKAAELAVWDPKGAVAAHLTARGIPFTATKAIDDIPASAKVLIVGPDAIPRERMSDPLWYERAVAGLKVLVLDQRFPLRYRALPADIEPLDDKPSVWAQMQAKASGAEAELRGRYGFMEDVSHAAFAGLEQDDFFTWGSDHVVYRNPYRKGTTGYRSLFQCEQGLAGTALAECQAGDGLMLLSQLAIGEKIASEAVAQQLFGQLLDYAADYAPVRRQVQVVGGPAIANAIKAVGVQHRAAADPLAAIAADGIAVIEGTAANLKALAAKADAVRAWCAKGNWLMIWGVGPDGIADFNAIARTQHVLRPFSQERVLMAVPSDPLTAGLTLRDVVMDTGKQMYPWMALKTPDADEFSHVVDHTDIAPFCEFPSPTAMGKSSDANPGADHWPRNMVNGFTSADNWCFCYTIIMDRGHKTKWTLTLPKEEEIIALKIQPSRLYHPITRMNLYFDDDATPVPVELRVDPSVQEVAIPGRKAKRVTMEVAQWAERGDANIVVIDNLWLMVKRPDDYLKRVKPLLNIGGLMRYDEGRGGIVLNQLKLVEREVNPVNQDKKGNIVKTILSNLGAVFAGQKTIVAGSRLKYDAIALPVESCTAYLGRDKQPAWWEGQVDMSGLPVGEQVFAGVRYLLPKFTTSPVPTAYMLRGRGGTVQKDRIENLPVGRKADALFLLHTFKGDRGDLPRHANMMRERRAQGQDPGEFPTVLTYRVRYADGVTTDVPVRWSRDIGHWLAAEPVDMPNAGVAWAGQAGADGQRPVVYSMQWNNPRSDIEITAIDVVAGEEKWGSAVFFAVTAATQAK
ncbi:MAG: hypothetical protein J0M02_11505 [Planctomycetes bacterium]|nr:hypothetical protein [Planctomycetota bacterium]